MTEEEIADSVKSVLMSRIFINEEGDLIVSDLWEEIYQSLVFEEGDSFVLRD